MDILARTVHILAAAIAIGGLVYARFVAFPVVEALRDDAGTALRELLAARLRPIALTVIVLLVLSGSYNLYVILSQGVDSSYHMAFGIKFLLALHVFAMLFLVSTPPSGDAARDRKRGRLMLGAIVSGLIVLVLGAYLRTLHS